MAIGCGPQGGQAPQAEELIASQGPQGGQAPQGPAGPQGPGAWATGLARTTRAGGAARRASATSAAIKRGRPMAHVASEQYLDHYYLCANGQYIQAAAPQNGGGKFAQGGPYQLIAPNIIAFTVNTNWSPKTRMNFVRCGDPNNPACNREQEQPIPLSLPLQLHRLFRQWPEHHDPEQPEHSAGSYVHARGAITLRSVPHPDFARAGDGWQFPDYAR